MRKLRTLILAALPAALLGACTMSLNDQDRAMLTSASTNAQQAKDLAQQALTTAQAAQASANSASQAANEAAKNALAANEKADRMFQRSLRKVSPQRSQ